MNELDTSTKEYLDHVIKSFSPGIRYACAYGSGVFKQKGHKTTKDNMIDFIFVVNDAFSWHYQTLQKYSHHYSFVKRFGPSGIATIQRQHGAGVFFNTRINFEDRMIKYGVIETKRFTEDLNDWTDLYIAGRLQKPVHTLKGLDDSNIETPFQKNLVSAVTTSLLTLPVDFEMQELFSRITSLSYTGDLRMIIGEDKSKVDNIVSTNMEAFYELYHPILSEMDVIAKIQNGRVYQDIDPFIQCNLLENLPAYLKVQMHKQFTVSGHNKEMLRKKYLEICENREALRNGVLKSVSKIVRRSSTSQTLKNSATAGLSKSIVYGAEKMRKMLRGLKR